MTSGTARLDQLTALAREGSREARDTLLRAVAAARELSDLGINLMIGANQGPVALAISPLMPEFDAVLVSGATPMSRARSASG